MCEELASALREGRVCGEQLPPRGPLETLRRSRGSQHDLAVCRVLGAWTCDWKWTLEPGPTLQSVSWAASQQLGGQTHRRTSREALRQLGVS